MICPNCKKNTDDSKDYCDYCGTALFGPRSINLDVPHENMPNNNTNIENITGIDIDSIKKDEPVPDTNKTFKIDLSFIKKNYKFLLIIIGGILLILAIVLMIINLSKCSCLKCDSSSKETLVEKKYNHGYVNNYEFEIPNTWSFESKSSLILSKQNNIRIVVHPVLTENLDNYNEQTILNDYNDSTYSDINLESKTLNSKKIIYIKYKHNNMNYLDFYYYYDSNNIIYGNIVSKEQSNLLNEENKRIISSLKVIPEDKIYSSDSDFDISNLLN